MMRSIELPSWPRLYLRALRPRRAPACGEPPVGLGLRAAGVTRPKTGEGYHALARGPSPAAQRHELLSWSYVVLQRLHAALLLSPDLPFPALGLVHVENRLERTSPEPLPIEVTLSTVLSAVETTSAGRRLTLTGEIASPAGPLATGESVYLARDPRRERRPRPALPEPAGEPWASLDLGRDFGRAYARVSGDRNPIHLWPWSARLFGFRCPIAHGMGLAAQVEARIAERIGAPLTAMATAFRSPLLLPATPNLFVAPDDGECGRFELRDPSDTRLHLEGRYTASRAPTGGTSP